MVFEINFPFNQNKHKKNPLLGNQENRNLRSTLYKSLAWKEIIKEPENNFELLC